MSNRLVLFVHCKASIVRNLYSWKLDLDANTFFQIRYLEKGEYKTGGLLNAQLEV